MTMRTVSSVVIVRSVIIGFCIALSGCQWIPKSTPGATNDTPMLVDQAMQIRDWDRSSAIYTNTTFVAGSTGFLFEPRYDNPGWSYALIEPPLFAAQVVALPVTIWFPPPWVPVNYASERLEPTYHGMPPLPPAQAAQPATPSEPSTPAAPAAPAEPAAPTTAPGN